MYSIALLSIEGLFKMFLWQDFNVEEYVLVRFIFNYEQDY